MATRMKVLGVHAVLVDGRVRDLGEMRGMGLPVSVFFFFFFCSPMSPFHRMDRLTRARARQVIVESERKENG